VARTVREHGADYVLAVKDNQPWLAEDVAEFLREARTLDFAGSAYATARMVDSDHGRLG
jgi:hypothetical protein